jgi:hypothetical protein
VASCDFDTEGAPCYRPVGHFGLHASQGHDAHCRDCGSCKCDTVGDCWVEDVGENEMVAVRLPRHTFEQDRV